MSWQSVIIPIVNELVKAGIEYYNTPSSEAAPAPDAQPRQLTVDSATIEITLRCPASADIEETLRNALALVDGVEITTLTTKNE
jgi:hypothetical protein